MTIDPKDQKIQDGELTDEQTEKIAGCVSTGKSPDGASITRNDLPQKFGDDSGIG